MVDTAGHLLWEKNYGTSWNEYGGLATSTYDHSFIVYRNMNNGSGGNTVGYVEKLDGKGNLIWSKSFPYNTHSSFIYGNPIENSDGTLTLSASVRNTDDKRIGLMLKLDPFGNTLWTKEYYTTPTMNQYIYDIKPTPDGGYVLAGSARDSNLVQSGWLIKTNCNGEEDVQHPITATPCDEYDCTQYPITAEFTPSAFTIDLVDGGEVIFENSSSNTTSRVWSFGDDTKVYTDGEVTHTYTQAGIYEVQLIVFHAMCSDTFTLQIEVTNTVGITTHTALEKEVTLYPNPNNGAFTLQNNTNQPLSVSVYDAMGKVVFQDSAQSAAQTNFSLAIPAGVYMVNLHQNGTIVTKKMVVR
jgi:PKD repeat protein